ncbi:MAG: alpha/beta hydrolase [Pseudomonadota bacterium]
MTKINIVTALLVSMAGFSPVKANFNPHYFYDDCITQLCEDLPSDCDKNICENHSRARLYCGTSTSANQQQIDDLYGSGLLLGGVKAKIFSNNPVQYPQFDKMLYVVGPYTFAGLTSGTSTSCDVPTEEQTPATQYYCLLDKGLRDYANNKGIEVMVIDFSPRPSDTVAQKASGVRRVLHLVERFGQGHEPSVMLGLSLGGVVARHALTTLERDGITHGVSHYISYDSPHAGAHIPLSLQKVPLYIERAFRRIRSGNNDSGGFLVKYIAKILDVIFKPFLGGEIGDKLDQLEAGVKQAGAAAGLAQSIFTENFDRPAVRELLIQNILQGGNRHPDAIALQNQLNILGFPRRTSKNIAIVNGSDSQQAFVPNSHYIDYESNRVSRTSMWFKAQPDFFTPYFHGNTNYYAADSYGYKNARADERRASTVQSYDRVPCAIFDVASIVSANLSDSLKEHWYAPKKDAISLSSSCYIPSISAAGGKFEDLHKTNVSIYNIGAFDEIISQSANTEHMSFSCDIVRSIGDSMSQVYQTGAIHMQCP